MMWAYLAFVFIGSAAAFRSDYKQATTCPKFVAMRNFDMTKFANHKWYEHLQPPSIFYLGERCVSYRYSIGKNGAISVLRKQRPLKSFRHGTFKGLVTQDKNEKAKLTVVYPDLNFKLSYWIVDTDYDLFAAMYTCENGVQRAWLLAKYRYIGFAERRRYLAPFRKHGIDYLHSNFVSHKHCLAFRCF